MFGITGHLINSVIVLELIRQKYKRPKRDNVIPFPKSKADKGKKENRDKQETQDGDQHDE